MNENITRTAAAKLKCVLKKREQQKDSVKYWATARGHHSKHWWMPRLCVCVYINQSRDRQDKRKYNETSIIDPTTAAAAEAESSRRRRRPVNNEFPTSPTIQQFNPICYFKQEKKTCFFFHLLFYLIFLIFKLLRCKGRGPLLQMRNQQQRQRVVCFVLFV